MGLGEITHLNNIQNNTPRVKTLPSSKLVTNSWINHGGGKNLKIKDTPQSKNFQTAKLLHTWLQYLLRVREKGLHQRSLLKDQDVAQLSEGNKL